MSTSTTVLLNQTYHNVTNHSNTVDLSSVDEIVFSISCDSDTTGMWALSRVDAFNTPYLYQEGSLSAEDFSMAIGPSSSFDLTNSLGSTLQIDITGASGTVSITLCVTGKAYT